QPHPRARRALAAAAHRSRRRGRRAPRPARSRAHRRRRALALRPRRRERDRVATRHNRPGPELGPPRTRHRAAPRPAPTATQEEEPTMSHPHLVDYTSRDDVDLVLDRLPARVRARVHNIHLTSNSRAVRRLGWVTRGRRDITLCATLPPRVGLHRYMYRGRVAADFGAPGRAQCPPWAVRRFLLSAVLLHELGHMQVAGGRYAREPAAQAFADEWNGRLYSEPFDHLDPVHNAPTPDELATLPLW